MAMPACPMSVAGTRVVAADTADGESLTFTTTPDAAPELRTRVRAMAETHNRHHATPGMEGMHGMRHGAMPHEAMPPPSRATVEDLDYGARILLTPVDPADVERLRSTVRLHAQRMEESGTCEMGPAAHE
ncbi:hypothetical protein [Anaeromyxobacter terrae]|uniref:hypothetical protein n=1 Tax=Anaeromyxobacter terrae TaxID=2925406 RepID=UPI001F56768F|nr:hypothetical protein [Anaeromyxobacter sp. SG22]